jgi:D-3-phosphoglycerate dehydrogenase
VVGTHHIGASTQQAQDATSAGTVDVIEAYRAGDPQNCVNVVRTRVGSATITIRHFDRVGVLAAALQVLRRGNINVQTMANKVFQGSNAAMAIIDVVGEVNDDLTSELASLDNVIQVQITARDE